MSTPSPQPADPQPDPLDQPEIEQQQEQSNSIGNEVGNALLSDPVDLYELAKGAVDLLGDVIKNIDLDISL